MVSVDTEPAGAEPVEVATYASGAPGFLAELRDVLLVADRGCLVVGDEAGHRQLVVFPAHEIDWDGETLTYRDRHCRPGHSITLAGGFMALQGLTGLSLPEACADTVEAFVIAPSGR